ncbi:MAG: hypothetical protein AB2739_13130 [Candidatus Thiodiazotropha endolucinida]
MLPDKVNFTSNVRRIRMTCEYESNDDGNIDLNGSIGIIGHKHSISHAKMRTVGFEQFNGQRMY